MSRGAEVNISLLSWSELLLISECTWRSEQDNPRRMEKNN